MENISKKTTTEEELERKKVLADVKKKGLSLAYASKDMQNDKEIVLEAFKNNFLSLEYASEDLRNDEEYIVKLSKINNIAFQYTGNKLKKNKGFILEAIKNGIDLKHFSKDMQNDKEIIMEALKQKEKTFQETLGNRISEIILSKTKIDIYNKEFFEQVSILYNSNYFNEHTEDINLITNIIKKKENDTSKLIALLFYGKEKIPKETFKTQIKLFFTSFQMNNYLDSIKKEELKNILIHDFKFNNIETEELLNSIKEKNTSNIQMKNIQEFKTDISKKLNINLKKESLLSTINLLYQNNQPLFLEYTNNQKGMKGFLFLLNKYFKFPEKQKFINVLKTILTDILIQPTKEELKELEETLINVYNFKKEDVTNLFETISPSFLETKKELDDFDFGSVEEIRSKKAPYEKSDAEIMTIMNEMDKKNQIKSEKESTPSSFLESIKELDDFDFGPMEEARSKKAPYEKSDAERMTIMNEIDKKNQIKSEKESTPSSFLKSIKELDDFDFGQMEEARSKKNPYEKSDAEIMTIMNEIDKKNQIKSEKESTPSSFLESIKELDDFDFGQMEEARSKKTPYEKSDAEIMTIMNEIKKENKPEEETQKQKEPEVKSFCDYIELTKKYFKNNALNLLSSFKKQKK
jgi:hypothetical protein